MAVTDKGQSIDGRGSAAAQKEKMEMDERKQVQRVLSVLETDRCGIFKTSDPVPRRVVFRYEGGGPDGGYSLVSDFANEEDSRRILSWLQVNADPDAFGCGLGHTEGDWLTID